MTSLTLTALLLSLLASLTLADPSLSVVVSGPSSVNGLSDLQITTTLQNTGNETLRLLNDPQSVLTPRWATDVFNISKAGNLSSVAPNFLGVVVKWSPRLAAAGNDFTILVPGQSLELVHDRQYSLFFNCESLNLTTRAYWITLVSARYDFSTAGEGTYEFLAADTFIHLDTTGEMTSLKATLNSPTSLTLFGDLSSSSQLTPTSAKFAKRAGFAYCSTRQQAELRSAISTAQSYASAALRYLLNHAFSTPRFTTWFGRYTSDDHAIVTRNFIGINGSRFDDFTYDCSCTDAHTFAYVYPNNYGKIYLCGAYWGAPPTGTDSKSGTLIHECSHFTRIAGTKDIAYGQSGCRRLAERNPREAIMNADSHEYFAENNPFLT
ncbi:hypothetical protein BOTBODRAFT_168984 [Botryobasidium botryosum FD-172 SS1]|uniref:Lysine-specific metallo-endopeptidase domain-containing protein n=1 Tax=Botryobasidium botryosum (strain FD-172 SS1) TaxID=930990 RepID=A0A067N198_BOTB1|nr:hypothetical protein BOTBODRAFT_168984 [Botryobasidium botryosum FD-172 SS1]